MEDVLFYVSQKIHKSYLSKQATYDEKMLCCLQLFDLPMRWAGSHSRVGEYFMKITPAIVS